MRLLGRLPDSRLLFYPTPEDEVPGGSNPSWCHFILPEFCNSVEFQEYHQVEDPPPPPPPIQPPPPPPAFVNERLYYGVRSVLKHVTPFFLRNALNSLLRHDEH